MIPGREAAIGVAAIVEDRHWLVLRALPLPNRAGETRGMASDPNPRERPSRLSKKLTYLNFGSSGMNLTD